MQRANGADTRRSSRVPMTVPVFVTSLEPSSRFSQMCETLVVNAHGCALRSPLKLDAGVAVQFHSKDGRETIAHVVACQPMGPNQEGWRLGVKLDRPENFWGLQPCPEEWTRLPELPPAAKQKLPRAAAPGNGATHQSPGQVPASLKGVFDKIEKQLSDDNLKVVLAELIKPMKAEVASLAEKLAKAESKRSKFDVSLTQIPPELEEQLWGRLRQDLGAQAVRLTQEQAAQVLGATNATIEEKVSAAQNDFRQRMTQELKTVEQRAHALAQEITGTVQRHLGAGVDKFQQQVLDAGARLSERGDQLSQAMHHRLGEEHDEYRGEMHKVQATVEARATQLQVQIGDLDSRTGVLDGSVRRLETELDGHLEQLGAKIASRTRADLLEAGGAVLKDLQVQGADQIGKQLDGACGRLRSIQEETEISLAESLKAQIKESMQAFEQTMEELAQHSVGRWRIALARDLNSVATLLGEKIRSEAMMRP